MSVQPNLILRLNILMRPAATKIENEGERERKMKNRFCPKIERS